MDVPRAGAELVAVVVDAAGAPCSIRTVVDAAGSWSLQGVPPGVFVLRGAAENWLITDQRSLDLGEFRFGRPDIQPVTATPTLLKFNLTNLAPLEATHTFQLNAAGAATVLQNMTVGDIAMAGATTIENAYADVLRFGTAPQLIDGEKGDRAYLLQVLHAGDESRSLFETLAVLEVPPFTQRDGQESEVAGAFRVLPTERRTFQWDGAAFDTLMSEAAAGPVELRAEMGWATVLRPAGSGQLCSQQSSAGVYSPPRETRSLELSVANPFPATRSALLQLYARYLNPSLEFIANIPLDENTPETLRPPLTSVRDVRVNGQVTTDKVSDVGLTPTISFQPPSVGTPDVYLVRIQGTEQTADYYTTETSVTLPAGLLQPGGSYSVLVRALAGGATAGTVDAPYRWWRESGYVEARATGRPFSP